MEFVSNAFDKYELFQFQLEMHNDMSVFLWEMLRTL